MGEDEDAAGARGVDEAHRGDGLAGAGRVLEPEALVGVGIVGRLLELVLVEDGVGRVVLVVGLVLLLVVLVVADVDLDVQRRVVLRLVVIVVVLVVLVVVLDDGDGLVLVVGVVGLVVDGEHGARGRRDGGAVAALRLGEQRRQRAGQGIDLMRVQRRAVGELGLVVGQHALEAEHERVAPPPVRRGDLLARVDLQQRSVERAPPGGAGRQRGRGRLARVDERLAGELLRALDVGGCGNGRGHDGHWRGISQVRLPACT